MSQLLDNGEWPNAASVPSRPLSRKKSLPLSRKRPRDNSASSNGAHPRKKNGRGNKTAAGSAELIVDLELANEEAVSPHRKRRDVARSEQSGKNDAAGKCARILKDKDVDSEDEQVADHRQSCEGTRKAASHPMNSDSEQTGRDDGSVLTSKPPSNASGQQWSATTWEDRLSELADYRKIQGHCNVPKNYSENPKLAQWVTTQRKQYKLHAEGKKSLQMTTFRIQELENIGFDWEFCVTAWEDRLSALAGYRKIHGHCNVPHKYNGESNLGKWVTNQRSQYRLHAKGKTSYLTTVRIQELESLGFEWAGDGYGVTATWEDRLRELADYCKIHGHCNVPAIYAENSKLGNWVTNQRKKYKTSHITTARIQELESIGFEWEVSVTAWEDRLRELADYRKIHGHCNVPRDYGENAKLATWVANQRKSYSLQAKGKTSYMTTARIQELESIGFEWRVSVTAWDVRLSELADFRKVQGHCNVPHKYSENTKLAKWVTNQRSLYMLHLKGKTSSMTPPRIRALESLSFEWQHSVSQGKGTPKKTTFNDESMRVRERDKDVASEEDEQVADHRQSPSEGNATAAAASDPMNSNVEQTSRDDGSVSTSKLPSKASRQLRRAAAWEDRLSELASYFKEHGHCNVPHNYNENPQLGAWVRTQRAQYRYHLEGKISNMTLSRIHELDSLSFEWVISVTATWEDRLSELVDYRKIHGHCNDLYSHSGNINLGKWVTRQRYEYRKYLEGKASQITLSRIQELDSMGFEWEVSVTATWEDRLSELADYRKIQGHCNVPRDYGENTKLAQWVATQRSNYKLHLEGKKSKMTPFQIQELESLEFTWTIHGSAWEIRLSELAEYRKIHGHCNVLKSDSSENRKLANWVGTQRHQYKVQSEGKRSQMTQPRIQALESLGFDWRSSTNRVKVAVKKPSYARRARVKVALKKPSLEDYARRARDRAVEAPSLDDGSTRIRKRAVKKPSLDDGATRSRKRAVEAQSLDDGVTRIRKRAVKKPSLDDGATRSRKRAVEAQSLDDGVTRIRKRVVKKPSLDDGATRIRKRAVEAPSLDDGATRIRERAVEAPTLDYGATRIHKRAVEAPSLDDGSTRIRERAVKKPSLDARGRAVKAAIEQLQTTTAQTQEDVRPREIHSNEVNVASEPKVAGTSDFEKAKLFASRYFLVQ
jgi:hypothetical protein